MSESGHSQEFEPVIFICDRHPSMGFQPTVPDEDGKMVGVHWQFENGVFIADTPDKLDAMRRFLKSAPTARRLIRQTGSQDEATNVLVKNMMVQRREKIAVAGPFTSDVMAAQNATVTEMQLQADMKRMGATGELNKDGSPRDDFANLADKLKNAATVKLNPQQEVEKPVTAIDPTSSNPI